MIIDVLKEKLEKREKIYSTMLCHIGFTGLPAVYKAAGLVICQTTIIASKHPERSTAEPTDVP